MDKSNLTVFAGRPILFESPDGNGDGDNRLPRMDCSAGVLLGAAKGGGCVVMGAVCAGLSGEVVVNPGVPVAEGVDWGADVEKLNMGAFPLSTLVSVAEFEAGLSCPKGLGPSPVASGVMPFVFGWDKLANGFGLAVSVALVWDVFSASLLGAVREPSPPAPRLVPG